MKLADYPGKRGVTLVEVLVVVTIMGILSGIGIASLRGAIMNSRIKDAGINATAFMERAANEATRLNTKLCVTVSGKTLKLYKGACNVKHANADLIDEFTLESPNTFLTTGSSIGVLPISFTPVHQIVHQFCKRYGDLWRFMSFASLKKHL